VITEPIAKPPSHVLPPIRFGRTLEDAVRRVHRRDPIDVVHAQFYPHLLGFSAPESTRVVVTEHNAHPWRREQQFIENLSALHAARWQADTWIRRVEAWKVFREADRVYSVSDAQGAWMEAAVPSVSSKRRTMYNFVNTETYRPDAQPEGSVDLLDGPTVLYAGRKVPTRVSIERSKHSRKPRPPSRSRCSAPSARGSTTRTASPLTPSRSTRTCGACSGRRKTWG